MAPLIPIFVAIGSAVGASAGTAAVVGGAVTALAVGGVAAGTAAVAHSMGKASGAKKAANSMMAQQQPQQDLSEKASLDKAGETGTGATRSQALYTNSSSGILGNASIGRRQLLAT